MPESKQISLPVTGMTCANCVATIERNLKKESGVQTAVVNLSSERATVEFDPSLTGLDQVIGRIQRAGYDIAMGEADLLIRRMSDDNDARRLEKALSSLEGVQEAQVSFASERARCAISPPWSARPTCAKQWPRPASKPWRPAVRPRTPSAWRAKPRSGSSAISLSLACFSPYPYLFWPWAATWVCSACGRTLSGCTG